MKGFKSSNDIATSVNGITVTSLAELVELISVVILVCLSFEPARYVFADLS